MALVVIPLLLGAEVAAASTKTIRYDPYTPDGEVKARLRVLARAGDCSSGSFVTARRDAWRCFTGRLIRDPCFENPVFADEVTCVVSPWNRRVVRIETNLDPNDRFDRRRRLQPWALRLPGRRCRFVSGATTVVEGRRLNYACRRQGPYLFGFPDRSRPNWTIRLARDPDGPIMRRPRVRAAWF